MANQPPWKKNLLKDLASEMKNLSIKPADANRIRKIIQDGNDEKVTEDAYDKAISKLGSAPENILSPGNPSDNPEVKQFLTSIETTVKRYFPRGYFSAKASTKFGHNSIYIATAVLPKGQQANGIIQNDPAFQTYWMHDSYDNNGLAPRIKIEMSQGGVLYGPNSSNREKIGWRNGTGPPAAILKKFNDYYKKLRAMVNARDDIQE